MERDRFKSRLGFILVSAGCAIGIGNVWKFPYIAGENGGGVFVILYLLFLVLMGIPVLTMEIAIGRGSGKSIFPAYRQLEPKGSKWHWHGVLCVIGCYLLMMYYSTVSGWMFDYCFKFGIGEFSGVSADASAGIFESMLANPGEMVFFTELTVILGFAVLLGGVKNGLEKITKYMMLALLALIVVLGINSLTLIGASEGLEFYLLPDLERASEIGWGGVISSAMNQAFFTLSIGIAAMEIFGSYMSKDNTLISESVRICSLDTFVALMSGLIIFPACFSFDVAPEQGPNLIFVTLPKIFINMPGGRIWGTLFFMFMSFASFSTVIAVFENLVSSAIENFKLSRVKSVLFNCLFMLVATLPCALGFNIWSGFSIGGKGILDIEDFIVSTLLLPIGALIYVIFCCTKFGWGFDNFINEANTGKGIRLNRGMRFYFRYVLPIMIIIVLISGFIPR